MKSFYVSRSDLDFLAQQVSVPAIRVLRYTIDGTPIYGYTNPVTGADVELGPLGSFNLMTSSWSVFIPNDATITNTSASPFGMRSVDGLFNNLTNASTQAWGAIGSFARSSNADYKRYARESSLNPIFQGALGAGIKSDSGLQAQVNALAGLAPGQQPGELPTGTAKLWGAMSSSEKSLVQDSTYGILIDPSTKSVDLSQRYANPYLTVRDYTPRVIAQTVHSQQALQRLEAQVPDTITDRLVYQITDVNTGDFRVGGYDADGNTEADGLYFKEDIVRNLNTLPGDPSLTGWNVLFGQFFDHGLDFIGKAGNAVTPGGPASKIIIPLDPSDPLWSPTNQTLTLSRASVLNPEAAGPDGMFRTADDILSPGVDQQWGTADDLKGLANPSYSNSTSPYIDQSQTYGSVDDVTRLLRQWVKDPSTGKFAPGMRLFNGSSLADPWKRQNPDGTVSSTTETLPTLNELRRHIIDTGRDDISWADVGNFRVRDAAGKVLDLNPALPGVQVKSTGQVLVADMLPRLDAAHLFDAASIAALKATAGYVDPLAAFLGVDRGSDTNVANQYVSDYVDLQTGRPTALGSASDATTQAIVGEILLRSIGDHYIVGDGRANENFGLTSIHHVWHENHNWQIDNLIHRISQEQALDPTRTLARQWQVAIPNPGDANKPYVDAAGNYTNSSGVISWNQEKLFQAALLINQMEYQHVAIDQYARGMTPNIPIFVMYDTSVNADVTLEYSQAAFRFGHSQIREVIDALDPNGSLTAAVRHYALDQGFLNPAGYAEVGPTAVALGMSRQVANELDQFVTPALQQRLLGQPQDLAAINIARGRDLGLPTLNQLRRALSGGMQSQLVSLQSQIAARPGDKTLQQTYDKTIALKASLAPYISWTSFANGLQYRETVADFMAAYALDGNVNAGKAIYEMGINGQSWSALTSDQQNAVLSLAGAGAPLEGWTAATAKSKASQFVSSSGNNAYESIDAWSGGIAEKHVFLGQMGPTFDAIFCDQMTRLINGDRFYYFWRLQDGLINATQLIESVVTEQFKDVIERTTGARHLAGDVFLYRDSYVELGEMPVDTSSGEARDHKYGDLAAAGNLGVYSGLIGSVADNGDSVVINGVSYITDTRPDLGSNPDGTAAKGYNAHEVIAGTPYADLLDAGDGDDTEYGDDGDDILVGAAGADHLYGELGQDSIYGDTLPDFLDGGQGNDLIEGGDDTDVLIGDDGDDRLDGGAGIDELHAGNGNDFLDGGTEGDFIFGGNGQDIATGAENVDVVDGEWGDDILLGGDGPDQLFGGYGDDILLGGTGAGNLTLNVDECLGEAGFDLVSFADVALALDAVADLNFQNVNQIGQGTTLVTPFGQLWFLVEGIEGGANADQIIGDAQENWLIGGDRNDLFSGGAGDDAIIGDSIGLSALNGLLAGKHFLDLQGAYPDYILGLNASLVGGGLQKSPSTPGSADVVTYSGASSNFIASPVFDPTNPSSRIGVRLIDVTGRETGVNGDLLIGVEKVVFGFDLEAVVATGPNAHKPIDLASLPAASTFLVADLQVDPYQLRPLAMQGFASETSASASLPANPGVNNLFTNIAQRLAEFKITAAPTIRWESNAGSTNSQWVTIAGATSPAYTIPLKTYGLGTSFRQVVTYKDANGLSRTLTSTASAPMGSILVGSALADKPTGTSFQDVIYGLNGNDILSGGSGDDYLRGDAGADVLDGGLGLDVLQGSSGNDIYILADATHHTAAEIADSDVTLGNVDEVRFASPSNASATIGQTLVLFAGDVGVERVVIGTGTAATADTTSTKALNIDASAVLNGLTILGNAGANGLTGTAFADGITGAAGVDLITAGAGADTIIGGAGLDVLTGGLDKDLFVLASLADALPGGTATARTFEAITDLQVTEDRIDVPFSTSASPRPVKVLGSVTALTDTAIGALLNASTGGQANFAANGAAVFTFVAGGGSVRTYLALNNGTAAYSPTTDAIIEVTGYVGNLAQIALI